MKFYRSNYIIVNFNNSAGKIMFKKKKKNRYSRVCHQQVIPVRTAALYFENEYD